MSMSREDKGVQHDKRTLLYKCEKNFTIDFV